MNDTQMTIIGNVVDEPRMRETKNGHKVTNFRIASTSRRFDREQERYVDNTTLFVNVTCWRGLAENVNGSVRKGQPVVVVGRFYMREYAKDEQLRTSYELEASAIGHDLSRGVTTFKRVYQSPPTVTVAMEPNGMPADDSDIWHDVVGSDDAGTPEPPADFEEVPEFATAV